MQNDHWWGAKDKAHESVFKHVSDILQRQSFQSELDARHYKMYSGLPIEYLYAQSGSPDIFSDRITFNLSQMMIEALKSKISKNKPRPTFLTDNGDWDKQQKAKQLDKFVYGDFYRCKTYEKTKIALVQAMAFGDGYYKVYNDGKNVCSKFVHTPNIVVDEREAIAGDPFTMYELAYVDRSVLKAKYPEYAVEIDMAQAENIFFGAGTILDSNLILVIEGFKLPLGKEGEKKGGKHFLGINNATFDFSDYDRDYFPYSRLSYQKSLIGYKSKGVCEILTGYQMEVNRTLRRIQEAMKLGSTFKVFYDVASNIIKTHFNNQVGTLISYQGTTPQFVTPQPISPQLFEWLLSNYQKAFEEVGLSQLTASSQKPAGLDSGKALREYNDIETERFASFAMDWQQFHLDIAELHINEAKILQEQGAELSVNSVDGDGTEKINFKDINVDKLSYVMQAYPVSMFSKDPSSRLAEVGEMINMGVIDPMDAGDLLQFPDVKKYAEIRNASVEDIKRTVWQMIYKGEYNPPMEFQALEYGIKYCQSSYLYYRNKNAPLARLDLLDRWVQDALLLLKPAEEQIPAQTVGEAPPELPAEEQLMMNESGEMPVM